MDGSEMKVWVDASSVGTRSEWERVEDACWLCPTEDAKHINLAELDAAIKGVNLAHQWRALVLHLVTDLTCNIDVYLTP